MICSSSQEAVKHVVIVDVVSGDRARVVDAVGEGALARVCARTGRIERGNASVGRAYEAVSHIAGVNIGSVNCYGVIDVRRDGTLESRRSPRRERQRW